MAPWQTASDLKEEERKGKKEEEGMGERERERERVRGRPVSVNALQIAAELWRASNASCEVAPPPQEQPGREWAEDTAFAPNLPQTAAVSSDTSLAQPQASAGGEGDQHSQPAGQLGQLPQFLVNLQPQKNCRWQTAGLTQKEKPRLPATGLLFPRFFYTIYSQWPLY